MQSVLARTSGLFAFLLLSPAALAISGETLEGTLRFTETVLDGDTSVSSNALDALHFSADETTPWAGSWTLQAGDVIVNWTTVERKTISSSPTDPNQSLLAAGPQWTTGDDAYSNPSLTSGASSAYANMLVVPRAGTRLEWEATTLAALVVRPSEGQAWRAGAFTNDTTALGKNALELTHTYATTPGQPVFDGQESLTGTIRGNFTVYVWGTDVTVRADNQEQTYRSGAWSDNATGPGPRGATRDEHWQFLRLRVTDAVLHLTHTKGVAQWTAQEMSTRTDGTVSYTRARGTLESGQILYTLQDETFQIRGHVTQRVESSSGSQLRGAVEAERATVNLAGTTIPNAPGSEHLGTVGWILVAIGAVALVGGAVWGIPRMRSEMDWSVQLAKAEDEVNAKRYDRSDPRLARLLRRGIPVAEARIDAWFLRGIGRIELGDSAWLLRELAPRMEESGNPPILAYLLTLAAVDTGDMEAARKWGEIVRHDRSIMEQFLGDERVKKHRLRLGSLWEGSFESTGYV